MIRLYRASFSTNVERVALALAHKGLEASRCGSPTRTARRSSVQRPVVRAGRRVRRRRGGVRLDADRPVLEERYPAAPLYPADFRGAPAEIALHRLVQRRLEGRPERDRRRRSRRGRRTSRGSRSRRGRARMAARSTGFEAHARRPARYLFGDEFSARRLRRVSVPEVRGCGAIPADDELFHRGARQLPAARRRPSRGWRRGSSASTSARGSSESLGYRAWAIGRSMA